MKYIKSYEQTNLAPGKYYWTIKSLPEEHWNIYAKKLLQKINCPDRIIKEFMPSIKNLSKYNAFYIILKVNTVLDIWDFTKIITTVDGYTNLGDIELNKEDLYEIELEISAKKYNL